MPVTVNLPSVLSRLAGGRTVLEASGATLGEVVSDLSARFPELGPRLRDEAGEPYPFVTFYVNDVDVRLSGGFGLRLGEGDEVTIVPAIAGGKNVVRGA